MFHGVKHFGRTELDFVWSTHTVIRAGVPVRSWTPYEMQIPARSRTLFNNYHTESKLGMTYCLTPFTFRFSTADYHYVGLELGLGVRV